MAEFLSGNPFFACALTIGAFLIGQQCQKKWKLAILNPIALGAILVCLVLTATGIPTADYQKGVQFLSYLLTPATICLSVPLYTQVRQLTTPLIASLAGVIGGTVAGLLLILGLSSVFGLEQTLQASLLPKSLTTAIGVALSQELGGIPAITTGAIILTGVLGNVAGPWLARLFRLKDPIAQGVAYGTASHVVGTSRAASVSELAGAVSSLSLTAAGLFCCVLLAFLF